MVFEDTEDTTSSLKLNIAGEADSIFDFGWTLDGAGILRVEGKSQEDQFAFNYGNEENAQDLADWTGEHFIGEFHLKKASASLDDLTARALKHSTAYVEEGAVLTIGKVGGEDTSEYSYLHGLIFDGGTVSWDASAAIAVDPDVEKSQIGFTDSRRKLQIQEGGTLNFKNGGTVSVVIDTHGDELDEDDQENDNNVTHFTLMEQDEGSVDIKLIDASKENIHFEGDLE